MTRFVTDSKSPLHFMRLKLTMCGKCVSYLIFYDFGIFHLVFRFDNKCDVSKNKTLITYWYIALNCTKTLNFYNLTLKFMLWLQIQAIFLQVRGLFGTTRICSLYRNCFLLHLENITINLFPCQISQKSCPLSTKRYSDSSHDPRHFPNRLYCLKSEWMKAINESSLREVTMSNLTQRAHVAA